jgi:hypothetical protein
LEGRNVSSESKIIRQTSSGIETSAASAFGVIKSSTSNTL